MGHYCGHKGFPLHIGIGLSLYFSFGVGLNPFNVSLKLLPSPAYIYFVFCPPHCEWTMTGWEGLCLEGSCGEGKVGGLTTSLWEESLPPLLMGSYLVAQQPGTHISAKACYFMGKQNDPDEPSNHIPLSFVQPEAQQQN